MKTLLAVLLALSLVGCRHYADVRPNRSAFCDLRAERMSNKFAEDMAQLSFPAKTEKPTVVRHNARRRGR